MLLSSNTWGGAEIHTLALTATLAERGHECVIVELDQPVFAERQARLAERVRLQAVPLQTGPRRPGLVSTVRVLRRLRADVGVFAKGWTQVGSTQLDLACRLAFRGRFVTIEHSTPAPRPAKITGRHLGGLVPGLGLWWYTRLLAVYARSVFPNRVVAVSRAVARQLAEHYGFPTRKIVSIPNGVDGRCFTPDPLTGSRVRAGWGVPQDAVLFGAVSRLSLHDKGVDVAVDLFTRLCAANPGRPLWCVLVGSGPDEAALRAQAAATGWGSRIIFPGPTECPWEAYRAMDVFLMPSRFEGLGLALLEAMASGCCPVVMGVGGIVDVVTDPGLGWVAPPGDREAFLRGMQAALDLGPEGRRAMGARARRHVLERFRAAEQYGKLADLIERI